MAEIGEPIEAIMNTARAVTKQVGMNMLFYILDKRIYHCMNLTLLTRTRNYKQCQVPRSLQKHQCICRNINT